MIAFGSTVRIKGDEPLEEYKDRFGIFRSTDICDDAGQFDGVVELMDGESFLPVNEHEIEVVR